MITRKHSPNPCLFFGRLINNKKINDYLFAEIQNIGNNHIVAIKSIIKKLKNTTKIMVTTFKFLLISLISFSIASLKISSLSILKPLVKYKKYCFNIFGG